tara:strand:+ start:194 stop:580 length:387 start_codon:yes stop_codon:yes gene_type:complete
LPSLWQESLHGWHQIPNDLQTVDSCNPFKSWQQDGCHLPKLSCAIELIVGILRQRIVLGLASVSLVYLRGSFDLRMPEILASRNHFFRYNHINSGALDDKLVMAMQEFIELLLHQFDLFWLGSSVSFA